MATYFSLLGQTNIIKLDSIMFIITYILLTLINNKSKVTVELSAGWRFPNSMGLTSWDAKISNKVPVGMNMSKFFIPETFMDMDMENVYSNLKIFEPDPNNYPLDILE